MILKSALDTLSWRIGSIDEVVFLLWANRCTTQLYAGFLGSLFALLMIILDHYWISCSFGDNIVLPVSQDEVDPVGGILGKKYQKYVDLPESDLLSVMLTVAYDTEPYLRLSCRKSYHLLTTKVKRPITVRSLEMLLLSVNAFQACLDFTSIFT